MLKTSHHFGLGKAMPDFALPDTVSKEIIRPHHVPVFKAYVLLFICNHCPYVKHIIPALTQLSQKWHGNDFCFFAISANDPVEYPADSPENMCELANNEGWKFPYLFDETQQVYQQFGIVCTPEIMVFSAEKSCLYHGRFDATTPGSGIKADGEDLAQVLSDIDAGAPLSVDQLPSMGCSVKWRN